MRSLATISIFVAMLSAAVARADEAGDQFAVAAGHYDSKRWKLAVEEFQTFLDKYPNHANYNQGHFFQAEALLQLGKHDASHEKLQQYLQREPEGRYTRPAMFRLGEAAYLSGKMVDAERELGAFVKKYPDDRLNGFALPYLGDIALGKKEYPLAESFYRDGLSRVPEGSRRDDCQMGLARALDRQGKNDEALRIYSTIASNAKSSLAGQAMFSAGALQYATGEFTEALRTFDEVEKRWPSGAWRANARLGRGWALMKLGRLDEASGMFQSVSDDPKLGIEARYWQGLVLEAKQQWPQAAKSLLDTAAAAPDHALLPAICVHAGEALVRAGQPEEAIKQFDLVLNEAAQSREGEAPAEPSESTGPPAARQEPRPPDMTGGHSAESAKIIPPPPGTYRKADAEDSIRPYREQALRGKCQAALLMKDYATVDREAGRFAALFPSSPFAADVTRIHARALVEQRQFDRAAALLEPLVAQKLPAEQELETRYLLAAADEGLRKYDEALEMLAPVVEAATDRLKSDAQLLQGSILLATHRYADAAVPLDKFLRTSATGDAVVQAAGQLAICYARTKRLDKAKKLYADLRSKYPDHPLLAPATEQLIEAAFDANDAAWSAELSTQLADLGKHNATKSGTAAASPDAAQYEVKGLAGLGWSQFKAGQLNEAAATFERVLQTSPPDDLAAEISFARGQVLEKLDQLDPALALYDCVVEKYPASVQRPDALYAAARLRMKLRQYRDAAALYEKLARDYPQYARLDAALYDWAWTVGAAEKPAEADKLYARLRKDYPKSRYFADATYRLAERAFESQDAVAANALLDELLAAKPEPPVRESALYLRAQVALLGKDWAKIRLAFQRLLDEFPETRQRMLAEFWIAECDYREKNYDEAGKRLEDLAKRIPGRQEPWMAMIALRRAQIAIGRKNWDEACSLASGIEKDFPDFSQQYEADLVLGRCLANRAEFEEARSAYGKVIRSPAGEKTETAAMAQWLIGETYFHQKNFDAALREYLRVDILYAYPAWQALALLEAAKCHEELHDAKQAEACYQKILDRYAGTPSAKQAKERMEDLRNEQKEAKKKTLTE
jgi:cellulose synthase operon protein C